MEGDEIPLQDPFILARRKLPELQQPCDGSIFMISAECKEMLYLEFGL